MRKALPVSFLTLALLFWGVTLALRGDPKADTAQIKAKSRSAASVDRPAAELDADDERALVADAADLERLAADPDLLDDERALLRSLSNEVRASAR